MSKKYRSLGRRRFIQYSSLGVAGLATLSDWAMLSPNLTLAANPITVENSKPGSPNWNITKLASDTTLQITGYASATSVNKGGSINFFVSVNTAQTYGLEIYRMGWYNGAGGRLIQTVSNLNAVKQTVPAPNSLGTVECTWPVAYTLNVDPSWTTGAYLAKLTNAQGFQNYIYFVVRDDTSTADVMFQCSATTYQAYNTLGGKSLYPDDSTGKVSARKVSLDRPLTSYAQSFFLSWELPTLRFIEKNGYDMAYCTNLDLHENAALMNNHKGFLSVGHDEYWSKAMYDNALAFRNSGKHLAFLGANEIYWQIRFENSAGGVPNRLIACYKDNFREDPVYIANSNSPLTTYLWRELPPGNASPAISRPENQLVGVMYDGYNNNDTGAKFVVTNSSHWIYANTGFVNGSTVNGIVGYEWDKRFSNGLEPAGLVQLSSSPVKAAGGANSTSNATIYQASSGAWVFAAGTIYWGYALDYIANYHPSDLRNAGIQRVMLNLLDKFVGSIAPPPAPAIGTISPTSAGQGGAAFTLTVNGSNFANGASVKWNGTSRTTTFVSASQLTAAIPATDLASAGIFAVTVTNPDNQTSNAVNFSVTAPPSAPVITNLNPNNAGQNSAGFNLTVTGTNFVNGAIVRWNGNPRATTFVSASQVTAPIASSDLLAVGSFPVTVINPDNQVSNAVNFSVTGPAPAPTITTLSPTGAAQGGAAFTLTVNGSNFANGASVKWNGTSRTTTFVNASQVTAAITAADIATVGAFPITVSNPDNQTSNAVNFTVTAATPAPVISTLSPTSASQGGAAFSLTVNGSNFVSGASVKWKGASRITTFVSASQLTAAITAADIATAGTAAVTVTNPDNKTSNAVNFSVTGTSGAPTITQLSPNSKVQDVDDFNMTVTGSNFVSGATVRWNGANRPTTFVSSTQLKAFIENAQTRVIGSFPVTVKNPDGTISNAVNFQIVPDL